MPPRRPVTRPSTHAPDAGTPPAIPAFVLYREPGPDSESARATPLAEMLHIEPIESRSRLYHWEIEPHVHHGLHQLIWIQTGAAEVTLDASRASCSGPGVIVIPPGVVHAFRFSPETDGLVLTLSPRLLVENELPTAGEALLTLFTRAQVLALDAGSFEAERLGRLFAEVAAEFHAPVPHAPAAASGQAGSPVPLWLARAVVWRLAQLGATASPQARSGGEHRALYTRFVTLVEMHFLEHWPITRYASRLGVSTDRLNRSVRAEADISALDLIQERLTREACRRLVYVAAPISKLAFELGFEDPAYFCRFFRRRTGLSPSAYRSAREADRAPAELQDPAADSASATRLYCDPHPFPETTT